MAPQIQKIPVLQLRELPRYHGCPIPDTDLMVLMMKWILAKPFPDQPVIMDARSPIPILMVLMMRKIPAKTVPEL